MEVLAVHTMHLTDYMLGEGCAESNRLHYPISWFAFVPVYLLLLATSLKLT